MPTVTRKIKVGVKGGGFAEKEITKKHFPRRVAQGYKPGPTGKHWVPTRLVRGVETWPGGFGRGRRVTVRNPATKSDALMHGAPRVQRRKVFFGGHYAPWEFVEGSARFPEPPAAETISGPLARTISDALGKESIGNLYIHSEPREFMDKLAGELDRVDRTLSARLRAVLKQNRQRK